MSIDSGRPDISGADRPDRAEQAAGQQARAGDRQPAERLSREEYSDRVRARGSPLGQHDTPTRGTGDSGQPGASPDKREVPVSDHLNGRSRDPDLNTSDIASGPGHRSNIADVPKTPQPARAETAGPAGDAGQDGDQAGSKAERRTQPPAGPAQGRSTIPAAGQGRPRTGETPGTELHELARTSADPALSADPRTAGRAQAQVADTQKRPETEPGATRKADSASSPPGTPPDNTRPEPRWDDAWNLPDGRQVRVHLDGDRDWMHSGASDTGRRPPTGEQLVSMEDDEASRSEKLRSKFFEQENCENLLDAGKESAKVIQEVLSPPQYASAHTLTPMVEIMPTPPPQADAGDALTGITVFALLSAEAVRSAVKHWRAMERT